VLVGTAVPDAILVVGNQPDPMFLLQADGWLLMADQPSWYINMVIIGYLNMNIRI